MSRERIHASEPQYHEELTEQEESLTNKTRPLYMT